MKHSSSICGYCKWLPTFFATVVRPHSGSLYLYGVIGAVRDFANMISFFIPLKVIMVLSNPDVLESQIFSFGTLSMEAFLTYACVWFFSLMTLSLMCYMILNLFVYREAKALWVNKKNEFPSRTKYRNLYQLVVDTITHTLIIVIGLFSVYFLDGYLAIPLFAISFIFILAAFLLARYTKNELLGAPLKEPKLIYKLISDSGFALIFLFILVEYLLNSEMNLLFTLLSVLMSRVILINMRQLFIKHRRLFDDYYNGPST